MTALQERLVGGRINRTAPGQARALLGRQLHLNLVGDGPRDVALQREDVSQIAFVLLGPQVRIRCGMNELCGDAHSPL